MGWIKKYICQNCGYEGNIYEGKGFMGQTIESVACDDCQTIQPLVTGGVIGDAAPSFRTIVGRICLNCGSMSIRQWNGHSCPKCQGEMEYTGEKEVVSLKVCNSSFLSLYFHCYFILFFPVFELIYSSFICCLCFLHRHGCQEEDDGLL